MSSEVEIIDIDENIEPEEKLNPNDQVLINMINSPDNNKDIIIGFNNLQITGNMVLDLNAIVNSVISQKASTNKTTPELVAKNSNILLYITNNNVGGKVLFQEKKKKPIKKEAFTDTENTDNGFKWTMKNILRVIVLILLLFLLYNMVKNKNTNKVQIPTSTSEMESLGNLLSLKKIT